MTGRPRLSKCLLVLLAGAGALWGAPAAADWLVTRDGARVETRDAWEVRGNLVVFHSPDGVFSSMRLDAVDLDRSAALTERTKQAAEAKQAARAAAADAAADGADAATAGGARETAPRPKAKFVLTDADVGHVEEAPLSTSPPDGAQSPEKAPASEDREPVVLERNPLEVSSWNATLGAGAEGVSISGVVKNPSEYFASSIAIEVTALSLEGEVLDSKKATVEPTALQPGERGSFRVLLPGVFTVGNALFEISSFNAVVRKPSEDD